MVLMPSRNPKPRWRASLLPVARCRTVSSLLRFQLSVVDLARFIYTELKLLSAFSNTFAPSVGGAVGEGNAEERRSEES